ncbi:MAG: SGNH/GDSL hydrolase family protein [Firmicutes bacterium]|jgi:acyl-CoA thioesterase-1|nr:SGNH/GDSL hydrolase family protein [Bacillota bacterium]
MQNLPFRQGDRILFQGDSVTDCGRDRADNYSLGTGYPSLIAAYLWAHYPELKLTILNRGVSGDRVYDLVDRWKADCIQLEPDWVSILVGVNDTWRRYDSDILSPIAEFQAAYRQLLELTHRHTKARVVLCDPFVLNYPADRLAWREDLNPRIEAIRQLAAEFSAIYIPLDGIMASACTKAEPAFWAADGVHPTLAGHGIIASAWLRAIGSISQSFSSPPD